MLSLPMIANAQGGAVAPSNRLQDFKCCFAFDERQAGFTSELLRKTVSKICWHCDDRRGRSCSFLPTFREMSSKPYSPTTLFPHNQQDTKGGFCDVLGLSDREINRQQKLMKAFITVLSLMVIFTLIGSVVFLVL